MPTVVLLGTLDTKGHEYGFVRDRIGELGVETLLIDAGILGRPLIQADIARESVAQAAGTDLPTLVASHDRDTAVAAMRRGATADWLFETADKPKEKVKGKKAKIGRLKEKLQDR